MQTFEHALGTFTYDDERGAFRRDTTLELAGSHQDVSLELIVDFPDEGERWPPDWPPAPSSAAIAALERVAAGALSAAWREVLAAAARQAGLKDLWALFARLHAVDVRVGNDGHASVDLWLEGRRGRAPDRDRDTPIVVDLALATGR